LRPALAGRRWTDGRAWAVALALALSLSPLPRTLQPLHAERAGFRDVGRWLSENTREGDLVVDPYAWAYYYSGRLFLEGREGLSVSEPRRFYVVMEWAKNKHPHLVPLWKAFWLSQCGEEVQRWSLHRGKEPVLLIVYEVPLPLQWPPKQIRIPS
jgi:hypothetical protein